jgi:hypothetical protein
VTDDAVSGIGHDANEVRAVLLKSRRLTNKLG